MNRISADNYDEMTAEQLREAIRAKHVAMNEALTRNQHLEALHRRMEDAVRAKDMRIESLEAQLGSQEIRLRKAIAERGNAQHLAALFYEKLLYLSDKKSSDAKAVVRLYWETLEEISRLSALAYTADDLARIFAAAEERVLGTKKVKRPAEKKRSSASPRRAG